MTALIFLLLMALVGTMLLRSVVVQEKIAGTTRDKQRAFELAQSVLQYGEWWLEQGDPSSTAAPCAGVVDVDAASDLRACTNALADPAAVPWDARFTYAPEDVSINAAGGLSSSGDANYFAKSGLYVNYLGTRGPSHVYSVTAYSYGGSESTVSVVQSTYQMSSSVKDLGQP